MAEHVLTGNGGYIVRRTATISGQGSTNYGIIYSNNSSMLPNNSYLGNYWFVNLGAK